MVANNILNKATTDTVPLGKPITQNLGTGLPQSLRDFANKIWLEYNATGKLHLGALPYRQNEIMRYVPKISVNSFIH